MHKDRLWLKYSISRHHGDHAKCLMKKIFKKCHGDSFTHLISVVVSNLQLQSFHAHCAAFPSLLVQRANLSPIGGPQRGGGNLKTGRPHSFISVSSSTLGEMSYQIVSACHSPQRFASLYTEFKLF